ncbi:MAG: hypothetical protein Q9213_000881 [Squamulea squamosa]
MAPRNAATVLNRARYVVSKDIIIQKNLLCMLKILIQAKHCTINEGENALLKRGPRHVWQQQARQNGMKKSFSLDDYFPSPKANNNKKDLAITGPGLDNAGKTTIVKKLMNEDVNTVSPTLGFIIRTIGYEGSHQLTGIEWAGDVGGQKTLRTYWRNYFEKTDALIWVVDAVDRLRMEDCRTELAGLLLEERLQGASLLIFSNKTDIAGSMSNEEIRKALALNSIKTHKWTIIQCSAITGSNVQEGIKWVVEDAKDRLFLY